MPSKDSSYREYIYQLLRTMRERGGSDLFISAGTGVMAKIDGQMVPLSDEPMAVADTLSVIHALMNPAQIEAFGIYNESNFGTSVPGLGRFRASAFIQRGSAALVLRTVKTEVPKLSELFVPDILRDLALLRRGLILVVGATGSGKSTTMAAMLDHRIRHSADHVISIEDPIEFIYSHSNSIVNQREVGVDTASYSVALKNALRQAPDVIMIGEIRDREAMESAVAFADMGHLCVSTLHATNASQAIDRIVNLFPEGRRAQAQLDLSLNLRAVISQRLIRRESGSGRVPAVEIMLNSPLMADLIRESRVPEIKDLMGKSREVGMQTFDDAIFDLYEDGQIGLEDAIKNADSVSEFKLKVKLNSLRARTEGGPSFHDDGGAFSIRP